MIYKVDKTCILYGLVLKELATNFEFDLRVDNYCHLTSGKRSDLKFSFHAKADGDVSVSVKDKRPNISEIKNWNFTEGLSVKDLNMVPREHRDSNINKFLSQGTEESLRTQLGYEYFWLEDALFLLIYSVPTKVEFRISGLHKLNKKDEFIIDILKNNIESTLDELDFEEVENND